MNLPASLAPDAVVWMRLQMTAAASCIAEPLHREIERVDEWANGLFAVLVAVLPELLRNTPGLAQQLEPQWRRAAERFAALESGAVPMDDDETMERLEAPKMLHGLLDVMGVWADCRARAAHVPGTGQRAAKRTKSQD